jgi:hypothetical protein
MGLKRLKARPEVMLGVTEKWEPCAFNEADTYLRGIIDILYEDTDGIHVEDWKTGQVYASHAGQMEFYTALVAAHYPKAAGYITRLVYIDQGLVTAPRRVEPDRVKPIRLLLDGRIKNAEEDTIFPVNPGNACKWCNYSQKFGGPCPN